MWYYQSERENLGFHSFRDFPVYSDNAGCVANNNAGVVINHQDFNAETLRATARIVINSGEMTEKATMIGRKLAKAGGVDAIVRAI